MINGRARHDLFRQITNGRLSDYGFNGVAYASLADDPPVIGSMRSFAQSRQHGTQRESDFGAPLQYRSPRGLDCRPESVYPRRLSRSYPVVARLAVGVTEAIRSFRPSFELGADGHIPTYTEAASAIAWRVPRSLPAVCRLFEAAAVMAGHRALSLDDGPCADAPKGFSAMNFFQLAGGSRRSSILNLRG